MKKKTRQNKSAISQIINQKRLFSLCASRYIIHFTNKHWSLPIILRFFVPPRAAGIVFWHSPPQLSPVTHFQADHSVICI